MSYRTWNIYGYGICVDDIGTVPVDRLQKMLDHAPSYHAEIKDYFQECGITDPCFENYTEYDDDSYMGLASILRDVIAEAEHIRFTACDDFDCRNYLVYEPSYPWDLSDREFDLRESDIREIFCKYVSMLTDEDITIDYQQVENGG